MEYCSVQENFTEFFVDNSRVAEENTPSFLRNKRRPVHFDSLRIVSTSSLPALFRSRAIAFLLKLFIRILPIGRGRISHAYPRKNSRCWNLCFLECIDCIQQGILPNQIVPNANGGFARHATGFCCFEWPENLASAEPAPAGAACGSGPRHRPACRRRFVGIGATQPVAAGLYGGRGSGRRRL